MEMLKSAGLARFQANVRVRAIGQAASDPGEQGDGAAVDDGRGDLAKQAAAKIGEVHQWRPRRSHYGELVQWDTSDHDWLEGRGEPVRHLVRMIDDATSRSWGRFVPRDGTRENMGVLWEYVKRYGRAVDYYTDRDCDVHCARGQGKARSNSARRTD